MQIVLSKNNRRLLNEVAGCGQGTISAALNFHKNSVLSRRIRSWAMNTYKGILVY